MTTTITTDEKNFDSSTEFIIIPEISKECSIRFLKYCSEVYISKDNLLYHFPEISKINYDELKVKITTTMKRNYITEYDFIPLKQVIEKFKNTNQDAIVQNFDRIINVFSKDSGIINHDETYDYLES